MHKLPPAQEVFDLVVEHLFTQGRPAYDGISGCMYRAAGGLRCAVGVLIPDDLYDPAFENTRASTLIQELFDSDLADWREHTNLLNALQLAHDACRREPTDAFDITDLRERLFAVAKAFSLEYRR
jgi:hypothetical protein